MRDELTFWIGYLLGIVQGMILIKLIDKILYLIAG